MAVRAMNFKLEESQITDMKQVGAVFNLTLTEIVREAVKEYLEHLKQDPFYRLTVNVQEASKEESDEILNSIDSLTDDDLTIVTTRHFSV